MKNLLLIIIGFIIGLIAYHFFGKHLFDETSKYVTLEQDYNVQDIGKLKKGTIIKIDKGMPEGFTRYILFLNLKGGQTKPYTPDHAGSIIPYWLEPLDTLH